MHISPNSSADRALANSFEQEAGTCSAEPVAVRAPAVPPPILAKDLELFTFCPPPLDYQTFRRFCSRP